MRPAPFCIFLLAALLDSASAHPGSGIVVDSQGDVSVALRSSDTWLPTGVVAAGDDLYALEFRYIEVERAEDWLPRVRKVSPDGTVTTLATVIERPR